ncbi:MULTISPECIES: hypothetical protein [unclassified Bradyrhizobium]
MQRLVNALLKSHRWINSVSTEQFVGAVPAGYKTDREVNIDIPKAWKAMFFQTSLMDAQAPKVPPDALSGFYPRITAAKVDLSKTLTNRFAGVRPSS